jgi:hypothetical protein
VNRSAAMGVIALALAAYGIYVALYIPPLVTGGHSAFLLAAYVVQACAALVAAVGIWRGAGWAPAIVVLFGAAIAVTELGEAFLLQIVAWLPAVAVSVAALVITITVAIYASRSRAIAAT